MATIIHGNKSDRPGTLTVADDQAAEKARALVRDGLRNEAWATVLLPDGRTYHATNAHGRVIDHYTRDA